MTITVDGVGLDSNIWETVVQFDNMLWKVTWKAWNAAGAPWWAPPDDIHGETQVAAADAVRLYRSDGGASLKTFVWTCADRAAKRYISRTLPRSWINFEDYMRDAFFRPDPAQEEQLEAKLVSPRLVRAINNLPLILRKAFVARYLWGAEIATIALIARVDSTTEARWVLADACQILRQALA